MSWTDGLKCTEVSMTFPTKNPFRTSVKISSLLIPKRPFTKLRSGQESFINSTNHHQEAIRDVCSFISHSQLCILRLRRQRILDVEMRLHMVRERSSASCPKSLWGRKKTISRNWVRRWHPYSYMTFNKSIVENIWCSIIEMIQDLSGINREESQNE